MNDQHITSRPSIRADLDPLIIPVIDDGGHGGIGHDDLNDPDDGVVLSIRMGPLFFAGDFIELFWDDVLVQAFPITAEHYVSRIIGFSVLPKDIIKPGVDIYTAQVYYVIHDIPTGTSAKLDPPREVLVKNTVPGNPDPVPDTPYLNENLLAPTGVPAEIVPPVAPVTLTIDPWQHMHDGDQLTVYWGGTQNKVTQPIVGVNQPQTVIVPADVIESGGDSPNLRVLYSIRDLASNWSLYSEAALTNVAIDPSRPAQPRILDDGQPTLKIDLDAPGAHVITVAIPVYVNALEVKAHGANAKKGRMALNDEITMTWEGETADGLPLVYVAPVQLVTDPGFGPTFAIPAEYVTKIANGLAKVFYDVDPADGTPNRLSRSSTVTVVRKQVEELAAPELLDANGGTSIDPEDVPASGASVNIPHYTGKQFGDIIYLLWEGKSSLGDPVLYEDEHSVLRDEETQAYVFTVDKSQILRLIDGSVKISYRVQFFASVNLPSASATYTVIGKGLLPEPTIDNVGDDGVFDPDLHPTTSVRVSGTQALLKVGDIVTIYWVGVPGAGTGNQEYRVGIDNQNLTWPIANGLIEPNRNTSVQVRYGVTRAEGGQQNSEVRTIQIKETGAGPVFGDESFELQPLGQLAVNVRLPFNDGLFITVMAAAQGSAIIVPGINEFGDRALNCAAGQKIKFEFGGEVRNFGLSHTLTETALNRLDFFDGDDVIVKTINLKVVSPGEIALEDVVLTTPCMYCELAVDTLGTMVDNFIWS